MPPEAQNGEGLNPFSEPCQARPQPGAFRPEQFDTAVGSSEQQQALKSSTFARGYEPHVFLLAEGGDTIILGQSQRRSRADMGRVPGSLGPLSFAGGPLETSDLKALATFARIESKAMKVATRLLNVRVSDLEFVDQQWTAAAFTDDLITADSEGPTPVSERATLTGRPTGPVQFFEKLVEAWGLDEGAGATLLGFEETSHLRDLLRGTVSLRRRDAKDRLRYLLEIDIALNALFRNEEVIKAWLRQPLEELGSESPLDHLREGSMEHLLRLKQLVEFLSGR